MTDMERRFAELRHEAEVGIWNSVEIRQEADGLMCIRRAHRDGSGAPLEVFSRNGAFLGTQPDRDAVGNQRPYRNAALALFALSLTACTATQPSTPTQPVAAFILQPAPDADTPASDPRAVAVRAARGIAAPACAVAADRLGAAQGNLMRAAVTLLQQQLGGGVAFTPDHLAAMLTTSISDPTYRAAAAVLVGELLAQVDARQLVPVGTTGHAMASAFVLSCSLAMGPPVTEAVTFAAEAAPTAEERAVRAVAAE